MTRTLDFRFVILRNGAEYTELIPVSGSSPSVRMDDSGEIKTSFTGAFLDPGEIVNWFSDQIMPEMILNGEEYPLGIFLPATIRKSENATTKTIQIEAYDKCWQVKSRSAETVRYFASGTNYLSAVGSLISESGITEISEERTSLVLTEGREDWDIGTSNLYIVNQLLSEINYKPLWFNNNGVAMLQAKKLPKAENIDHTLDDTQIESMIFDQMGTETDIYSAPNVFLCICSNADKDSPMVAMAENTNAKSPLSIMRRGRRITQVVQLDNIASQIELQAYANRLVADSMMGGETITVETALLPEFGVGDVTALRFGDLLALTVERAWSMDLRVGGKMKHTLEKVVMNVER